MSKRLYDHLIKVNYNEIQSKVKKLQKTPKAHKASRNSNLASKI